MRTAIAIRAAGAALYALLGCGSGSGDVDGEGEAEIDEPVELGQALPNALSRLGYNLDYPGDWTNLPPFIDQMQNARAPRGDCREGESDCDEVAHLDLDDNGWVRSLAYRDDPSRSYASVNVAINTSDDRADIGETFVVTWRGRGSIEVDNATDVELSEPEQRLSFTLRPEPTFLRFVEIDPEGTGDYLRDVRVFRADLEPLLDRGEQFNPEMIEFLAPFRSLRFMDWMASNAWGQCSEGERAGQECYAVFDDDCGAGRCVMPGRWRERPTADQPSRLASGQYLDVTRPDLGTRVGGYALETLVDLANRVPADPHFNVPVDFDEEYLQSFAEYVRDHLSLGLTATIEYGNEVWNWGFPQATYANELGLRRWPEEGSAWVQLAAGRTAEMCGVFKQVFAGQQERVRCLISPQTGWRDLAETVLECPAWQADQDSGPCYSDADAINVTGYFAGCLADQREVILDWLEQGTDEALQLAFEQLEHGDLIEECSGEQEDSLDFTIDGYRYFHDLAEARGLGLYVYESGTHFEYGEDDEVYDFLVEMTRDERMYDLYTKNFEGFVDAGGDVMNVWGWIAPDDTWANAESVLDREHPKYRAIVDFSRRDR